MIFKIILIFYTSGIIFSCKGQDNLSEFTTSWYEVKKNNNKYYIIDCGYEGSWVKIQNDSIYDHGIMEENTFKIKHIIKKDNSVSFYISDNEKYELIWIDKKQGIVKLINGVDNNSVKYFVDESHLKNTKKIKGTSKDCVSSREE